MEIRIVLDALAPPTGRVYPVRAGAEGGVVFTGWLGLLRALSDLIDRDDPSEAPATRSDPRQ
ncbi:MAG TPA: hypothetical protein VFU35_11225 [Jatrophihabitans sp.]|nr:hypothetical protein [Jatrophihabitans sp.]